MWHACHSQHLSLDLPGRRGAFSNCIDVRGSLATNWATLAPLHLAWHACRSQHLSLDLPGRRGAFSNCIDVRGSLATNWVTLAPLHLFGVAGVRLSACQRGRKIKVKLNLKSLVLVLWHGDSENEKLSYVEALAPQGVPGPTSARDATCSISWRLLVSILNISFKFKNLVLSTCPLHSNLCIT